MLTSTLKALGYTCIQVTHPWCPHYAVFSPNGKRINYPTSTWATAREAWAEAKSILSTQSKP